MAKAIRQKKLRNDSSLGTAAKTMEKTLGLPEGSVRLVKPNGRKMKGNASIETLKKAWQAKS